ncbi:MAG: acyl-CoA dehydrogenase family protein [Rikenellaceae bacterium]|nr:acyl-CoA dehydrogenase family protein [Rikenellaceae bacterium]
MMSEQKTHIIEEAKLFADRGIRPYANLFEENEGIPRPLIEQMAARKYLAATFPACYGGLDLSPLEYGFLTKEIGMVCPSTRSLLTVHVSLVGESILKWGSNLQKEQWLPVMAMGEKIGSFALTEPATGSDARAIKTSYIKKDGKFIVNGKKNGSLFLLLQTFFLQWPNAMEKSVLLSLSVILRE